MRKTCTICACTEPRPARQRSRGGLSNTIVQNMTAGQNRMSFPILMLCSRTLRITVACRNRQMMKGENSGHNSTCKLGTPEVTPTAARSNGELLPLGGTPAAAAGGAAKHAIRRDPLANEAAGAQRSADDHGHAFPERWRCRKGAAEAGRENHSRRFQGFSELSPGHEVQAVSNRRQRFEGAAGPT